MSANPSAHWFWNDWDNDRGLLLCSFAAQGLWMRMLSIAARAGGYVMVDDIPCTTVDIVALVGHSLKEITPLIAELERRHVFSRTRNGTIYNRRMVRDEKQRKTNRKNGQLGGRASVEKQRGIFKSPNRPAEPTPSGPPSPLNPYYPLPLESSLPLTPSPLSARPNGVQNKTQDRGSGANGQSLRDDPQSGPPEISHRAASPRSGRPGLRAVSPIASRLAAPYVAQRRGTRVKAVALPEEKPAQPPPPVPLSDEDAAALDAKLTEIADPNLRAALAKLGRAVLR